MILPGVDAKGRNQVMASEVNDLHIAAMPFRSVLYILPHSACCQPVGKDHVTFLTLLAEKLLCKDLPETKMFL